MAETDLVTIYHPGHGDKAGVSEVSRKAYDRGWRRKGYRILDSHIATAGQMVGRPVLKLEDLDETELATVVYIQGGDVDEKATKTQLAKQVTELLTEKPETSAKASSKENANG